MYFGSEDEFGANGYCHGRLMIEYTYIVRLWTKLAGTKNYFDSTTKSRYMKSIDRRVNYADKSLLECVDSETYLRKTFLKCVIC